MTYRELSDLEFQHEVLPPYASYLDVLMYRYGWGNDSAKTQVECLRLAAAGIYKNYGGGGETLPLLLEPVDDIVRREQERLRDEPCGGGFEQEVVGLALRYLRGEGDDYPCMNQLTDVI